MMAVVDTRSAARELRDRFGDSVAVDAPLAPLTAYRVGGPADALVTPETVGELQAVVRHCLDSEVPMFVLGSGANILVADEGVRAIVLVLSRCCDQMDWDGELLYVGAGRTVWDLVTFCEREGLEGLDFMSGIPGTVGGALTMNAGAFVGEIGDRVARVAALDERGDRIDIDHVDAGFAYRRAPGLSGKILLGCWLTMRPGDSAALATAREEYLARRAEKQPLEYPSCGSVFKRPPGDYAGRLIEAVGGMGMRIGGAMVSPKHANFIVNTGGACARDIYELIATVQDKVATETGVRLETEVKLIGFSDAERRRVEGER